MPFRRRSRPKLTRGKKGVKHADTLITTSGSGSVPTKQVIVQSDAGNRVEDSSTIQSNATTSEICRIGDLVKFVNIHLQVASRDFVAGDSVGWLEYACVWKRQEETDLTIAELGTLTLGTVATNRYRNDCIWTGFIPVGSNQPNGANLALKMPKAKMYLSMGEEFVLFTFFRSQNAASAQVNSIRSVTSYNYKAYS